MIEVARTQDEEVGDGTTSVIILGKRFNVDNHQLSLTEGNNFPMHLLERWKEKREKIYILLESGFVVFSQRLYLNMV